VSASRAAIICARRLVGRTPHRPRSITARLNVGTAADKLHPSMGVRPMATERHHEGVVDSFSCHHGNGDYKIVQV